MDSGKFERLGEMFESKSYEKNNKNFEVGAYALSWVGNILSLFFTFVYVKNALYLINPDYSNSYIILGVALCLLAMFELVKREALKVIIISYLKFKQVNLKTFFSIIGILLLISFGFYMTVNGASKFADSSNKVAIKYDSVFQTESSELKKQYVDKITYKEQEKQKKIATRDNSNKRKNDLLEESEGYEIEKRGKFTVQVKVLDKEVKSLDEEIKSLDEEVKSLEIEQENSISKIQGEIEKKKTSEVTVIGYNKTLFFLLSALIEVLIIFGVCFHWFFLYKSYTEEKDGKSQSPGHKTYIKQLELLKIIYQNGVKKANDVATSDNHFKSSIRSQSPNYTFQDINSFLATLKDLEIVSVQGKRKYFSVSFEEAKEKLKKFNN